MGKHVTSLAQKVEWLVRHPEMWAGWPSGDEHMDRRIIDAMRKDGLISKGAHNYDVGDLGKPIGLARAQLRSMLRRKKS